MGKVTRKRSSADFKARVALEAIKGEQTLAELGAKHGVRQTMIAAWKRQAIEGMAASFGTKADAARRPARQIFPVCTPRSGSWWLNGIFGEGLRSMSVDRRRQMIEPEHGQLSIFRQCALLSISRSGFYYEPTGETAETLALMRLIDEAYLMFPYYGSRQMVRHLPREGHVIGRKKGAAPDGQDGPGGDLSEATDQHAQP